MTIRVGIKKELVDRFEFGWSDQRPDETIAELADYLDIINEGAKIVVTNKTLHRETIKTLKAATKSLDSIKTALEEEAVKTNAHLMGR